MDGRQGAGEWAPAEAPAEKPGDEHVQWLSPEENNEWDEFVACHPLGLVYHLSSWQNVLETAFKHIHGRVLVLRDDKGQIQAGLPVYDVTSWLLKNRTVSVPFASICDPLVSNRVQFNLLWGHIEHAALKHRSKRIEIRTRQLGADCIPPLLTAGARYKHHYLSLSENTEKLLRSFHESCIIRRIKKAKREGVVVEERKNEESLRSFHSIMASTRRGLLLPPMPYVFFEAMYRCMGPDHASLYLAIHEGQPIGGMLALKFKDTWIAEYSGHLKGAHSGADQALYWHVIQLAKNSGAKFFSFGRTALDSEGLLDYKRRWATIEEDLTDYDYYFGPAPVQDGESTHTVKPVFYSAARLMQYVPASVQQMLGDFCYRHLG